MRAAWQRLTGTARWTLALVLLLAAGTLAAAASFDTGGGVPRPQLDAPRGERCVRDAAFMRRNHMTLLLHQRDRTVHAGERAGDTMLTKCIGCHANAQTQSVIGTDGAFCQSCHAYVAVKLDCFECHSSAAVAIARQRDGSGGAR